MLVSSNTARGVVISLLLVATLTTTGFGLWLSPTKTAEIHYRGETMEFPLSLWSRLEVSEEGHARYLGYGYPDFGELGELFGGFEYVDQMGSLHYLRRGDLELVIVTKKRTRWFTEMRFDVRPRSLRSDHP